MCAFFQPVRRRKKRLFFVFLREKPSPSLFLFNLRGYVSAWRTKKRVPPMWTNVPIPATRPCEFPNKYFHTVEHISVRLLRSSNPNSETEHVCHPYKSTLIYFSIATYLNGGRNRVRSGIDLCSIKDEIMSLFGFGKMPATPLFRVYFLSCGV